jgi:hypothetical protein
MPWGKGDETVPCEGTPCRILSLSHAYAHQHRGEDARTVCFMPGHRRLPCCYFRLLHRGTAPPAPAWWGHPAAEVATIAARPGAAVASARPVPIARSHWVPVLQRLAGCVDAPSLPILLQKLALLRGEVAP